MPHTAETPPPPAPGWRPTSPVTLPPLFHTDWEGGGPIWLVVVPPTPVTNGWLAGSSTASPLSMLVGGLLQSSDPPSPEAEMIVWPCAAACSNSVLSACAFLDCSSCSHSPHETEITLARLSLMILLNVSYGPVPGADWVSLDPS